MNTILPSVAIRENIPNFIAKIAVRALYFEVKAYPKPGLVSFNDAGAHKDMNGATFYRSIFTLRHYFSQISRQSLQEASYDHLKLTALQAEQRMLAITQGINTHRGSIFALGILCVSAAKLFKHNSSFTPKILQNHLLKDWRNFLSKHESNTHSHGALVRQKYKIIDAKEMALRGYDILFEILPSFISLFLETKSIDTVCLFAYSMLLTKIDDTNVLYRHGESGLQYARKKAIEILTISCLEARRRQALEIHYRFSQEGISPGGVADLIGALLFLGQLFCEQLRCHY